MSYLRELLENLFAGLSLEVCFHRFYKFFFFSRVILSPKHVKKNIFFFGKVTIIIFRIYGAASSIRRSSCCLKVLCQCFVIITVSYDLNTVHIVNEYEF